MLRLVEITARAAMPQEVEHPASFCRFFLALYARSFPGTYSSGELRRVRIGGEVTAGLHSELGWPRFRIGDFILQFWVRGARAAQRIESQLEARRHAKLIENAKHVIFYCVLTKPKPPGYFAVTRALH